MFRTIEIITRHGAVIPCSVLSDETDTDKTVYERMLRWHFPSIKASWEHEEARAKANRVGPVNIDAIYGKNKQ